MPSPPTRRPSCESRATSSSWPGRSCRPLQPGAKGRLALWSAGCSSGEEPYTLAMVLLDAYGDRDLSGVKIYASDLSTKVLAQASRGVYPESRVAPLSPEWRRRFFQRGFNHSQGLVRVKARVRQLITSFPFYLPPPSPLRPTSPSFFAATS